MDLTDYANPGQHLIETFHASINLPFLELTKILQRYGEKFFAAALLVAFLQAMVALLQYRTNPCGELIAPPGLTCGVAKPEDDPIIVETKASSLRMPSLPSIEDEDETSSEVSTPSTKRTATTIQQSRYAKIINRVNRWLVLLLPWAARQFSFLLERNAHLLHVMSIMTLAGLFDLPQSYLLRTRAMKSSRPRPKLYPTHSGDTMERLVVIGDSLAIGMGSVGVFDKNKNYSVPFARMENTDKGEGGAGPVFPRAFAQRLAQRLQKPVAWRSAGVDGGDVPAIEKYCLGVIQEQVDKGQPPDTVVIICGINDLKYFFSNPLQSAGPRKFRSNLADLIKNIQRLSPNATVILPALPTQMFHRHSPINIFPLAFFLDAVVGFWDSQKKLVADSFSSSNVMYQGLSALDVLEWYKSDQDGDDETGWFESAEDTSLIAADGVHPNARCYACWATTLVDYILTDVAT